MKKEQKIWKSSGRKYIKSVPKSEEEMNLEVLKRKLKIKLANFGEIKNVNSKKMN